MSGRARWRLALAPPLAGLLLFAALPARAEGTAREFLARIDRGESLYLNMLYGYANGMNWSNTYLESRGQAKIFCMPERLEVSPEQNADILRRHIATDEAAATAPAGLALLIAYRAAFPCSG